MLTHLRFDALTHGRRFVATARARVVRLHRDWEAITVSEQREACGTGDGVSQVVVAAGTVVDRNLCLSRLVRPFEGCKLVCKAVAAWKDHAASVQQGQQVAEQVRLCFLCADKVNGALAELLSAEIHLRSDDRPHGRHHTSGSARQNRRSLAQRGEWRLHLAGRVDDDAFAVAV